MKNEEAINELRNIRPRGGIIPQRRAEAIDVAISALENADRCLWHDVQANPNDLPFRVYEEALCLFKNKYGELYVDVCVYDRRGIFMPWYLTDEVYDTEAYDPRTDLIFWRKIDLPEAVKNRAV